MSTGSFGQKDKATNRVIPDGEMNCVWVDAGLVSYKLCDRGFECENCPFDRVMRQQPNPVSESVVVRQPGALKENSGDASSHDHEALIGLVGTFLNPPQSRPLPTDRMYTKNHMWAKEIDSNRYRIGLDHFAASLLQDVGTIILPQAGTVYQRNMPFAWIILDNEPVAVRSPLNGKIAASNSALRESPSVIYDDPYDAGWLIEATVVDKDRPKTKPVDAGLMNEIHCDQFRQLQQSIISDIDKTWSSAGTTMMDGGGKPKSVRDIVGAKKYTSMLKGLLSVKI